MIYKEKYIDTVLTCRDLISILSSKVPVDADIEMDFAERSIAVEVWYDEETNTVLLK